MQLQMDIAGCDQGNIVLLLIAVDPAPLVHQIGDRVVQHFFADQDVNIAA